MSELGLYRLLTPYFLAGFNFPPEADKYLSKLGVTDLTAVADDSASVFTGTLVFGDAPRTHAPGNGKGGFRWDDIEVRFRITVPRDGANFIDNAVAPLTQLKGLLDRFLPVDATPVATEYPGVRFRLELMLDELHFELSDDWKPAKLDADHRVVRDLTIPGPTRIVLPKVVLCYEQTDDFQSPPALRLMSWGGGGFAAPSELRAGELVRMEPPVAVHRDGRVGLGFGAVVVDLDPDSTPPEILQFFGVDEAFKGIYVQSARVYYADAGKDLAINVAVKDLLISFGGEVSLDVTADVIGPMTTLSARLVVVDQGKNVDVSPGVQQPSPSTLISGGKFRATTAAQVQVDVNGGVPPVTIAVKDENDVPRYDSTTGTVTVSAMTARVHTLSLRVQDSGQGSDKQTYEEDIEATLIAAPSAAAPIAGAPADRPLQPGDLPNITTTGGNDGSHSITHAGNVSGTTERFQILGLGTPTVTVNGQTATVTGGMVTADIPESTTGLPLVASWPAQSGAQVARLQFNRDWPLLTQWPNVKAHYLDDSTDDAAYRDTSDAPGQPRPTAAAVRAWLVKLAADAGGVKPSVEIDAHASRDSTNDVDSDLHLSERRRDIALGIIGDLATIVHLEAHGQAGATSDANPADRNVIIRVANATSQPAATITLNVSRGARAQPPAQPVVPQPTSPPKPLPNKPPGVFRRAGIRVKILRNQLALIELTGQLDFETEMESRLRNPSGAPALGAGGSLGLKQQPAAVAGTNNNPKDGVVDFRLTVVHDPAVHSWTETLAIGAHPDDLNGLLQLTNPHPGDGDVETRLKNLFGSVLILSPIVGTAVGATDPNSAGSYAVLGGTLVGAAAIGAAGFVQTSKVTLYGGELRFRQFIPPGDPASFTDAGVVFDYGVEFGVDIDAIGVRTTQPLKVRYRAIGFNLNFAGGGYQPIFDTSKGYELDLSDPGLFKLPSPIDNVLKILGARIAKVNPLTVQFDLGMKVDLGVVTIERFKVKLPIDPPGVPTILPSGIKVDISQVLVGSGYVNIIDAPAAPPSGDPAPGFGGIEGAFDISLVPVKLRIAASFGIRPIQDGPRKATAVFLGLIIDLPAPIVLGQSGIGIYGFSGLFAMHYKRLEFDPDPTDASGPAILWLKDAGGEPAKLFNAGKTLWGPEFDRWSFGVGVSLGTMEGGFLVNLRGMFVLELPGPRILIFVKVLIVQVLPDLKPATDLTVGILAVIDLDFRRGTFTIGIIVDIEVKDLVSVIIPVELFSNLKNLSDWHLYVGTFGTPASAMILNVVRGFGYFMIAGHDIPDWPGYGNKRTLPGIAVATGFGAAIVFGDEDIGLYLEVSLRADISVTFSPRLQLIGRAQIDGELRLFVVSIGAHGTLEVEAMPPEPTRVQGEICGHVDLFFFSVEGCVKVESGATLPVPDPPSIVRNVWLQSHAPVITAGQGGDRPIDASLGDAPTVAAVAAAGPNAKPIVPVVPIDSVPVVQFAVIPTLSTALATFTEPLVTAPGLPPGGWVELGGGRRVTYSLTGIRLEGPPPSPGTAKATWRLDAATMPMAGRTNIDLALLSNVPMMGARALERSTDLHAVIDGLWGRVCDPIAPPASVLWTFCRQPLGPSRSGWQLPGKAWPDPAGTVRSTPVTVELRVEEPAHTAADELLDALLAPTQVGCVAAAKVIGPNSPLPPEPDSPGGSGNDTREHECFRLADQLPDPAQNPTIVAKRFRLTVLDANGVPFPTLRLSGMKSSRGIDIGWRAELTLTATVDVATLTLVTFSDAAVVTAYDAQGSVVDRVRTSGTQRTPEPVTLKAPRISQVVIQTRSNETVLTEVCLPVRARGSAGPLVRVQPPRGEIARPVGERLSRGASLADLRGVVTPAAGLDTTCMRALQLPERFRPGGQGDLALTRRLRQGARTRADERWIDLATGPLERARVFVAIPKRLSDSDSVRIEQLDSMGTVVVSAPLSALSPVTVTAGMVGLPPTWIDPAGPWRAEVEPVATFLNAPDLTALHKVWVEVTAKVDTVRLRIRVDDQVDPSAHPAVLLGAVELLTRAEGLRASTEEASRAGQVETLTAYLNGTASVPLLAPDTAYTLHIDYVATAEDQQAHGGPLMTTFNTTTESFRFDTDANPPARLDAYVLAMSPRQDEEFVFADDVVKIVFNDRQIVQLYGTYGRTLTAVLRGADGIAIPTHQVANLSPVPAKFSSPLYDTLNEQVLRGRFTCMGPYHREGHWMFTLREPLRTSMDYTLEIEARPIPTPTTGKPIVPLFSRQFRTGRFRNIEELVDELQAKRIVHKMLTGPVVGLAPGEVTDLAMEAALVAAGLPALGAPTQGTRIVLWRAVSGRSVPHAILLDASEPLWRFRDAPTQEVVPSADATKPPIDPAYQRIVPGRELALELAASSPVTGFVHSPAGTRTIVFLADTSWPASGVTVTIDAVQTASTLYDIAEKRVTVTTVPLGGHAPWEDDGA